MTTTDRTSVVAEAVAYTGIVAILSGAALAAYPSRLGPDAVLAAILAAALWGAAAAVPGEPRELGESGEPGRSPGESGQPGRGRDRIRSALLAASLAPFAELIALCTGDGLGWAIREEAIATAAATLAVAAVLWRLHRRLPQQAAVLVLAAATVGVATTYLARDSLPLAGAAIWALGAIWFTLAWGGMIAPRRGATVLGTIAALLGAGAVMLLGPSALMIATLLILVLVAVRFRDLILLGLASAGGLIVLPFAVGRLFNSPTPPAVLLAAAGGLLVASVIFATRRPVRRGGPSTNESARDWTTGSRRTAVVLAVLIAAAVATVIAVAGT
jgi:hypothetical protein